MEIYSGQRKGKSEKRDEETGNQAFKFNKTIQAIEHGGTNAQQLGN
jgi:hypothetical protein